MSERTASESAGSVSRDMMSVSSALPSDQEEFLVNIQEGFQSTLEHIKVSFINRNTLESTLTITQQHLEETRRENDRLRYEIGRLHDELKTARLEHGKEISTLQNDLAHEQATSPYTLVLIDGDGLSLPEHLLMSGRPGGLTLASSLHSVLTPFLPPSSALHVKIFANLPGLARHAHLSPKTLHDFAAGFSDPGNAGLTDFIDVGDGKELADEKIKAELRWCLKSRECKAAVLLGVAHDNGYARVLSEVGVRDDPRIVLCVETGRSVGREIDALTIRKEKLSLWPDAPAPPSPASTTVGPPPGLTRPNFSYAAAVVTTPPESPVMKEAKPVLLARRDPEIVVSREAMLRVRKMDPKPCNNYYLKDGCCMFEPECRYGHDYLLGEEEIAAMRKFARYKKCTFGEGCTNESCFYGHS